MTQFPPSRDTQPSTFMNRTKPEDAIVYMNPYKGYSNSPYIVVLAYHPDCLTATYKYDANEGCYYLQTPEGYTDFFYHKDAIQVCTGLENLGRMETVNNNGGYGGRDFKIKVVRPESPDPIQLNVRGPWSGGCYCANKVLPKPATEVTYKHPCDYIKRTAANPTIHWSHTAGNLTIEVVNKLLNKAKLPWMCFTTAKLSHLNAPEFRYAEGHAWFDGIQSQPGLFKAKEQWEAATVEQLDRDWKAADGQSHLAYPRA